MLGSRLGDLARRRAEETLASLGLEALEPVQVLGCECLFKASLSVRGFTLDPLKFDLELVDALTEVVRCLVLVSGSPNVGR
jgi:hypothetical protein